MSLVQPQYFYSVELRAIEEQLNDSMDRVDLLREKAMKRNDVGAANQIGQLQRVIDVAKRRVGRFK
jgi:hypothetical protein